jgi:hypothetical protein
MQWLACQASLTEEIACAQHRDYAFPPMLGYDADLDLAALNKEDTIGWLTLPKDELFRFVFRGRSSASDRREKDFEVEFPHFRRSRLLA